MEESNTKFRCCLLLGKRDNTELELATRPCLFRILWFLDSKLPEYCAIYMYVTTALITADPSFRVYFRLRQQPSDSSSKQDELFEEIVGIRFEQLTDANHRRVQKIWNVTAWTVNDVSLPSSAYRVLNLVDWNNDIVAIRAKGHNLQPSTLSFLENKLGPNIKKKQPFDSSFNMFYYSIQDALNITVPSPLPAVYVKSLEECHAQKVYDNWSSRNITTVDNIAFEINHFPSAGVFLKENDELVSWMMCHPPNGMVRLNTLESHRRKGYASLVTKYLTKRIAQIGCVPFTTISVDNIVSQTFFESLGFKMLHPWNITTVFPKNLLES